MREIVDQYRAHRLEIERAPELSREAVAMWLKFNEGARESLPHQPIAEPDRAAIAVELELTEAALRRWLEN